MKKNTHGQYGRGPTEPAKKYSFSLNQNPDGETTANSPSCKSIVEKNGEIKYYYEDTSEFNRNKYITENIQIISTDKDIQIDNGTYIWILITCNNETYFIYIRVISVQEFGTKHSNLLMDYFLKNYCGGTLTEMVIHYSGEFKKTDDGFFFNFSSGTYMAFSGLDSTNREKFFEEVNEFLEEHNITPAFLLDSDIVSIITEDTIITTYDMLINYTNYGMKFLLFNTTDECKEYVKKSSQYLKAHLIYNQNLANLKRFEHLPPDHYKRKSIKAIKPVLVNPTIQILNDPSMGNLGYTTDYISSLNGGRLNKRRKTHKPRQSRVKNIKQKTRVIGRGKKRARK